MLKRNTRYLIFYDFLCALYLSIINLSSKNSSEIEFYRKKIINQHFFSRKSRKAIRKEMHMFTTREENMRKKIE